MKNMSEFLFIYKAVLNSCERVYEFDCPLLLLGLSPSRDPHVAVMKLFLCEPEARLRFLVVSGTTASCESAAAVKTFDA